MHFKQKHITLIVRAASTNARSAIYHQTQTRVSPKELVRITSNPTNERLTLMHKVAAQRREMVTPENKSIQKMGMLPQQANTSEEMGTPAQEANTSEEMGTPAQEANTSEERSTDAQKEDRITSKTVITETHRVPSGQITNSESTSSSFTTTEKTTIEINSLSAGNYCSIAFDGFMCSVTGSN